MKILYKLMSNQENSNYVSVPTAPNHVTMTINHHNKNPFLAKKNPKKLC